ncbi:MAG: diguanylate cyclase [Lamprobacter sp.]|uniref:sensor domain-containing diguanylate cyclase n=1 Tax=Lamprobacter sp. TaxID=3100796 RepID=UPI002B25FB0C|nr:diguanylate cyclase [Lamprobacter sp.]MEA3639481.1 diguanylate cyclase [Lamprobacter sp.]
MDEHGSLRQRQTSSLEQFQQILAAAERIAQLGHWYLDLETQRVQWSPQVFRIFRREPSLGEPSFPEHEHYLYPEDWSRLQGAVTDCATYGKSFELTLHIRFDDGIDGYAQVYGTALTEPDGSISKLVGLVRDVTQKLTLEAALCKREADYRLLVEQQNDLIVKVDAEGRFLFVSPGYCRTFGKRQEELIGQRFLPLVHPDDRVSTEAAMAALYQPPYRCYLEQRAMTNQGWRWFGWSDSAVLDSKDQVIAIIGSGRDIHVRKLAELELLRTQRMLELALESGNIATYTADFTTGEVYVDERYMAQLGYEPGAIAVTYDWWKTQVHPQDLAAFGEQSQQVLHGELDDFKAEYRFHHHDGHWIWLQDHARVYDRNPQGVALAATGLRIDVTQRKEAELKLAYRAEHDPLTDLLNRRGMWRAIRRIHAQGLRARRPYCVAIFDLDWFKRINDQYGHLVGDGLLREVAHLFRDNTRESDWIARWGGEEFLVLMPDTDLEQAVGFVERLRLQVETTDFCIEQQSVRITTSAGIARCRFDAEGQDKQSQDKPGQDKHHQDKNTQDEIVNRADRALYAAKHAGRNRVCIDSDGLCTDSDGD